MNYLQREAAKAKAVKAARSTETLAEAQSALDQAKASYVEMGGCRAYDIARAQDRVEAAKARVNARFQDLDEFAVTANGQEYMDLAPDTDLVAEWAGRNSVRVAGRNASQPKLDGWRRVPVG